MGKSKLGAARKILFVIMGTFALILGVIGIVLPFLPTTPFLLLAAGCYLKGSERLYERLRSSKLYGRYLAGMAEKKGMTAKAKKAILIPVLGLLLIMALVSGNVYVKILAIMLGAVKTAVFLRIKTIDEVKEDGQPEAGEGDIDKDHHAG